MATFTDYLKQHPDYYFSNEDLQLGMSNPDFADAIMQAKDLYYTTGDEKTANRMAEQSRAMYGNYTAGSEGSGYTPTRTYAPQNAEAMNTARDMILNYPQYASPVSDQVDAALDRLLNRSPFSYDYKSDPTYQSYATQYTQQGQRAMEDTLASLGAASGGMPSTSAVSAAQQQQNVYMNQLSGVIPELYQAAYDRYNDDYSRDLSNLSALQSVDETAYGRYGDTYNRALDNLSVLQGLDNTGYSRYRDMISDDQTQQQLSEQQRQQALENSRYDSETDYDKKLTAAQTLAAYGDFSGYKALGYTDSQIANMQAAYKLSRTAAGSGGSGGGKSGKSSSGTSASASLFEEMKKSGNPYSYLASHYKDYGVAYSGISGVYQEYLDWAGSESTDYTQDVLYGTAKKMWTSAGTDPDDVYDYLTGKGMSEDRALGMMEDMGIEYTPKTVADQTTNRVDTQRGGTDWIYVPGYGRMSWTELLQHVENGDIVEVMDEKTGKHTYKKK